jgi:hypothetical protein
MCGILGLFNPTGVLLPSDTFDSALDRLKRKRLDNSYWTAYIASAVLVQPAKAAFLDYQVNGVVSQADTTFGSGYTPLFDELGFVPTAGDALTLKYLVDTTTPGTNYGSGNTQYSGALSSVTLSVNHLGQVGTILVPIQQAPDSYVAIQNNANYGSSYQTGYYASAAPSNPVTTGNVTSLVFYTIISSAAPLSPPLYPDTSISQAPLAAGTLNLGSELGLNEVEWANGIFVASNSIGATHISASVSPVPLPAAVWLLISGTGGLAALARKRRDA